MPKATFTDQENIVSELAPAGDYAFEVIKSEGAIRTSGKTNGCEAFDFQIRLEKPVGTPINTTIWEDVTFGYEKLQWKLDTFLKSANFLLPNGKPPEKGESFDIAAEDILHLRGWCTVKIEDYEKDGQKKQTNRVAVWITNREKLPRNAPAKPEHKKEDFGF